MAGGFGESESLNTVEMMNHYTKQWTIVCYLPHKCTSLSGTVCGETLYLAGGITGLTKSPSKSVFTCSIPKLLASSDVVKFRRHNLWKEIRSLPVTGATLVSLGENVLAIGGMDDSYNSTSNIYRYDSHTDSWIVCSQMINERTLCLAVTLAEEHLVVVGGCTSLMVPCNIVEIMTLTSRDMKYLNKTDDLSQEISQLEPLLRKRQFVEYMEPVSPVFWDEYPMDTIPHLYGHVMLESHHSKSSEPRKVYCSRSPDVSVDFKETNNSSQEISQREPFLRKWQVLPHWKPVSPVLLDEHALPHPHNYVLLKSNFSKSGELRRSKSLDASEEMWYNNETNNFGQHISKSEPFLMKWQLVECIKPMSPLLLDKQPTEIFPHQHDHLLLNSHSSESCELRKVCRSKSLDNIMLVEFPPTIPRAASSSSFDYLSLPKYTSSSSSIELATTSDKPHTNVPLSQKETRICTASFRDYAPCCMTLISTLSDCTEEGREFTDVANNFSLEIPEGAIPEGRRLNIDVGVSLFGPFQFPESLRPVSPIFWVCVEDQRNFQFSNPITVTIPHFVDLKNDVDIESLGLTFLKADHNKNSEGQYEFKALGGEMDFKSECGVLRTTHFCSLCIAAKDTPRTLKNTQFCITAVLPRFSIPVCKRVDAYFFVTFLRLNTCLKKVEKLIEKIPGTEKQYRIKKVPFKFCTEPKDPSLEMICSDPSHGQIGVAGKRKVCCFSVLVLLPYYTFI